MVLIGTQPRKQEGAVVLLSNKDHLPAQPLYIVPRNETTDSFITPLSFSTATLKLVGIIVVLTNKLQINQPVHNPFDPMQVVLEAWASFYCAFGLFPSLSELLY